MDPDRSCAFLVKRRGASEMNAKPVVTSAEIDAAQTRFADAVWSPPQIVSSALSKLTGAPIRHATLWARNADRAAVAASETADYRGIGARATASTEAAVKGADVILTTTPATAPILLAGWLEPGQHVTSMRSDRHTKNELEPACLARAARYVPDRLAGSEAPSRPTLSMLTLRSRKPATSLPPRRPAAASPTRSPSPTLSGTGVQDIAIASLAPESSDAAGMILRT